MYRSKHFSIEELVPPELIGLLHEDVLWKMFDPDLLKSIDKLKEVFDVGSISINTFKWSGNRTQSGLRTIGSKYYSKGSMHSVGKAIDCVFSAYTTEEVREYILDNPDEFAEIGRIEEASWLHIDTKPRVDGKILVFKP